MIVLVLGGTRSGKSEVAERLTASLPPPITYVATGTATDASMAARISTHRARRPAEWATREAGAGLVETLKVLREGTVLVDSLGTWVAAHDDLGVDTGALVEALAGRTGDTVIVSEEVGLSVHAATELGRRFVDALGTVNLAVSAAADEVLLVIAGRVLPLDPCPRFERD